MESSIIDTTHGLQAAESQGSSALTYLAHMQLNIEDLEDCNRRNTIMIWGLPKATTFSDLEYTTQWSLSQLLGDV